MTSVLWLRRDLRLHDLPALLAAAEDPLVVPLVVLAAPRSGALSPREAGLVAALHAAQESYDGAIVVRFGEPEQVVPAVVAEAGATSVHISAEPEPGGAARDERVRRALSVPLIETGSPYAVTPGRVVTGAGTGYRVFTPFSKAWLAHGWRAPAEVPAGLRFVPLESAPLPELPAGMDLAWPGERAAQERWDEFLTVIDNYDEDRDRPDLAGTSRLGADLSFGTIHPRTLLADLAPLAGQGVKRFVTELAWREFYADVTWRHPTSLQTDLTDSLAELRYDDPETDPVAAERLAAWQQGLTGYPLVDAGMRQLAAEGWMHNRVRMVTASFLAKHLHLYWRHGADFFLDALLDGDVASNSHGWQWVAGTGTDAAPYFRVFNPILQGKKFDPSGDYVRRWVPELSHLAGAAAHEPWRQADGYRHGYPRPIVEHSQAREEALLRYREARELAGT